MEASPTTNEEVRRYYEECHSDYKKRWEREGHRSIHLGYFDEDDPDHGESMDRMKAVVADAVDIGESDRVLDAGCGLGETATWLADNRGADVVGLNITDHQIEYAEEMAEDLGVADRTEFRFDDFTVMDTVDDDAFDVVWGLESICYANDKRDFLEQAKRVLKPGGRIVVADGYMNQRDLTDTEQKYMRGWLDGWRVPHLAHVEDFTDYLDEFGFRNVEARDITENVMPSSKALYRFSLWGYPLWKLLHLIGLRTETQVENTLACYYQHKSLKRRIWIYAILTGEL